MLTHYKIPALFFTFCFLFSLPQLKSQDLGAFPNLLQQTDSLRRAEYLQNLSSLQNAWNMNAYNFGGVLDSLANNSPSLGTIPAIDSIFPNQQMVSDSILAQLLGLNLSPSDTSAVANQLDSLYAVYLAQKDSLAIVFSANQGQLNTIGELPTTFDGVNTTWYSALDSLKNNQNSAFTSIPGNGPGNFEALLDELFNPALFTAIELSAGMQDAKVNYYYFAQEVKAPVLGIRTVEQFDRTWEARWRVQGSWVNNPGNDVNFELVGQQNPGINPFMFNGTFQVMYNPTLGEASSPLRLVTLMGAEGATYAPAHRNPAIPATQKNVGYTTGWGPVLGGGLATKAGATVIYAIGTSSFGNVVFSDGSSTRYKYRANRFEAGIRYGNLVTLRYEIGLSNNWADDGNKNVRYHQVTFGLPTSAFFRN